MQYTITSNHLLTRQKQFIIQPQFKINPKAGAGVHSPEEQQYSHEKGLEIVVPIELCSVIYSYLPKGLGEKNRKESLNFPIGNVHVRRGREWK